MSPELPPDLTLGLDIGTTSTIGLVLRPPGEVLASASRKATLASPHPGWAEEDPAEWWANACAVLQELTQGGTGPRLAGICVTGMLPALVLLDAGGRLIRPSIQQSDGRCGAEVAELRAELIEADFLQRSGNGINQQLLAAKLRWLARHEPENFAQISTVMGSYDYINYRLTGRRVIEQNWALEAGFIDIATGEIAPDLVALAGITPAMLPPLVRPEEVIGTVSPEAARATGLPEGLKVMGGAADHIVSALASGIVAPGQMLLKFGGAGDVVMASQATRPDPRLYLDRHMIPGLWAPNGCMAASGTALNWLAALLAPGEAFPHPRLDALAAEVPPGSEGLICLPYFLGEKTPIHDPDAAGSFVGLGLGHGPGHLWRALLESVAYGFRHHAEVLAETGQAPERFYASDGGSRSRVWMQICADVLGAPLQLFETTQGSAQGAGFVAAIGAGLERDWSRAAQIPRPGALIRPDPRAVAAYEHGYHRYRSLYRQLAPWFAAGIRR